MAFEREIEGGIEQWVARTYKSSKGLALWRDQVLFKRNPLVSHEHRITRADLAVAVANRSGHVGDFVAARLALADGTAQALESL